ncbi:MULTISPECIES: protein-glutamate O-methyltransferase CheR [Sphingomonadaceae]|uniref:CheR family methyltransferase n=1 Tax=Sphingomonadaceae TaxID=41297 RepID=UPI00115AB054|nr:MULTISPECIES: protein-glutamate O-methyltransferase CheR [Sphingomonadaceae]QDK34031.1 chemotaxis protein CheR [Sphingomonas sp. IC081]QSR17165.1 chemotaxis protein CheR [Novosphingobium sp. KA1]
MSELASVFFEPPDCPDRIDPAQFEALAALIHAEAGINLQSSKQTMLEGRLRRRARSTGHASLRDYCAFILDPAVGPHELEHLINAVTTNKTDFFREPRHFDFLVDSVLPAYLEEGRRTIRCWSAACSIGAEPYTLAMLLDEFSERRGGPDYRIVATDLDTDVLAAAIRGVYPREMVEPVPLHLRRRYVLEPRDPERGEVRIAAELRRKIGFGRLNLIDRLYPLGEPFDVIFCRNVLIYFDKPTQEAVVTRLCDQLQPGGYLFLGHSESISGFRHCLEPVGGTVFQRK